MRPLPISASVVLVAGLLLGVAGNALLRPAGPPALNLALWTALVAGTAVLLHRRSGARLSVEAMLLLGTGVAFTAGMAWRDAESLKVLALLCAVVAFALPAFRAGLAWLRRSSVAEFIAATGSGVAHGPGGMLLLLFGSSGARTPAHTIGEATAPPGSHAARIVRVTRSQPAAAAVRGLALAVPLLLLFGGLFVSADAVFAGMMADVIRVDLDTLANHVVVTAALGWLAAGYLRGFVAGTDHPALASATRPRTLFGIVELATALGLLQLLFLVFVVVQFRYLFGGSALVEVTPGLSYAEYARRGFFELVAVVLLSLPLLLLADALLHRHARRDDVIFRILAAVHITLVFAVMVSALQRLRLYTDAYGLTVDRLNATALLILLAAVLAWFAFTVLRGDRDRFVFGTVVAAFATVAALFFVNPDALVARTNVARVAHEPGAAERFDARYAASLSADAAVVLLQALPSLPADAQCVIAHRMLERWGDGSGGDWRSWNYADVRAREMVRRGEAELRSVDCGGERRVLNGG
jgi:hypothetical protein